MATRNGPSDMHCGSAVQRVWWFVGPRSPQPAGDVLEVQLTTPEGAALGGSRDDAWHCPALAEPPLHFPLQGGPGCT